MLLSVLKHRSVQIFAVIALYLSVASWLPLPVHQGLYAISLFIKDLLLWLLPITVCFFIGHAIASFEKRAPLFVLTLFIFEALSNMASVWYAYGCGHLASYGLPEVMPYSLSNSFDPLWRLGLLKPQWWSADKGSFLGIILGILASLKFPALRKVLAQGKQRAEWILTRFFSRLIPLFILGFVTRMHQTRLLNQLATHYAELLLWLVVFLALYIALLFWVGSRGSNKTFFQHVRHLLPAAGVAFSSGCSLSTMPWTIEGTAKNLKHPDLAKAVIPATTNIQQIGDCIANTFLCFLIYRTFYGSNPDISTWLSFSLVFVLARFATAAVIGGAIFIVLPLYESYLHFNGEMIAIILAFNVILDPLITSTNVIANGALCRIFEKTWGFLIKRPLALDTPK